MNETTLNHYRLVRLLGRGGMGEVYLADDTRLGRRVALKVLRGDLLTDPDRRRRFEREARTAAALNHPSIVTIFSIEESGTLPFLTMEYVEGRPLAAILQPDGLSIDDLLRYAIPLCDAVAAAHARDIVHRDLKPANVMITDDGRVKVLDFGLAKLRRDLATDAQATRVLDGSLTQEGHIVGTVDYMSPEQAQGKPLDHRSDLFSLGVMLYEMATGRRPFRGDNPMSVLSSIIKDSPQPVAEVRADVPPPIGRLIRRCLEKDPGERIQSAIDIRHELDDLKVERASSANRVESMAASGERPVSAAAVRPAEPRSRASRAWTWVAVFAIVGVLGAAVSWPLWRSRSQAAPPVQPGTPAVAPSQDAGRSAAASQAPAAPPQAPAPPAQEPSPAGATRGAPPPPATPPVKPAPSATRTEIFAAVETMARGLVAPGAIDPAGLEDARALVTRLQPQRSQLAPIEREGADFVAARLDGRLNDAFESISRLWQANPKNANFAGAAARLALQVNRPRRALEIAGTADLASMPPAAVVWVTDLESRSLHLLGRYQDELALATRAGMRPAADPRARAILIRALAGAGQTEGLARVLLEGPRARGRQAVAAPAGSEGEALVEAALELGAHGSHDAAVRMAQRAAAWYLQLPAELGERDALTAAHAEALTLAEHWDQAQTLVRRIARQPLRRLDASGRLGTLAAWRGDRAQATQIANLLGRADRSTLFGWNTYWRAAIAAVLGDKTKALELLRQSYAEGYGELFWRMHREPAFAGLRGDPAFEEFRRVKD